MRIALSILTFVIVSNLQTQAGILDNQQNTSASPLHFSLFKSEKAQKKAYVSHLEAPSTEEEITEILNSTKNFEKAFYKASVYEAYLEHQRLDHKFIDLILVDTLNLCESHKKRIYLLYLKHKNADPRLADMIALDATEFKSERYRSLIYKAYLEHANTVTEYIHMILTDTQKFAKTIQRNRVHGAYLKRNDTDQQIIDQYNIELNQESGPDITQQKL